MKLEDIKTENDARQAALDEKILAIYTFYYSTAPSAGQDLGKAALFYGNIRNHAIRKFEIDTTPYDNVALKYVREHMIKGRYEIS
ncbi:hypothetical protein HYT23_05425 [Candidatus Pacearchaeota archaeon]|nr:hypothetical protein [Candidatus Pacearchaeota archaeon]